MSEFCAFTESGEEGIKICRKCNRTIKTKLPVDKVRRRCSINKPPNLVQKGLHFGKALVNHIADGGTKVTDEQWRARLEVCGGCEHKNGNSCSLCGCGLSAKAKWRSEDCPIDKWPKL